VGALVAACATPYGYLSILKTFDLFDLGDLLRQIGELRPMNPYTEVHQEIILLCLMAMALIFGAKIGVVRVLMIFGLLHLALQHVRGLAIFALVLPLILAHPLQQQFAFLRPTTDPLPLFDLRRFRARVTAIALVTTFALSGLLAAAYVRLRADERP